MLSLLNNSKYSLKFEAKTEREPDYSCKNKEKNKYKPRIHQRRGASIVELETELNIREKNSENFFKFPTER